MLDPAEVRAACADVVLMTERTVVRWPSAADRELLLAHERDPRIMAEIRDPLPEEALVERVDRSLNAWDAEEGSWAIFVVEHRGPGAARTGIGVVAMHVVSYSAQRIELGWRLHPDWHGQGLATEAMQRMIDFIFETLKARKLVAFCTVENTASWRLMERLGMQREGRMRDHSQLGGQWRDDFTYSVLQPEWRQARAAATRVASDG